MSQLHSPCQWWVGHGYLACPAVYTQLPNNLSPPLLYPQAQPKIPPPTHLEEQLGVSPFFIWAIILQGSRRVFPWWALQSRLDICSLLWADPWPLRVAHAHLNKNCHQMKKATALTRLSFDMFKLFTSLYKTPPWLQDNLTVARSEFTFFSVPFF